MRVLGYGQQLNVFQKLSVFQKFVKTHHLLFSAARVQAGAHPEPLVFLVEVPQGLPQRVTVGADGAFEQLCRVITGVGGVNCGGKVDAARVHAQR